MNRVEIVREETPNCSVDVAYTSLVLLIDAKLSIGKVLLQNNKTSRYLHHLSLLLRTNKYSSWDSLASKCCSHTTICGTLIKVNMIDPLLIKIFL